MIDNFANRGNVEVKGSAVARARAEDLKGLSSSDIGEFAKRVTELNRMMRYEKEMKVIKKLRDSLKEFSGEEQKAKEREMGKRMRGVVEGVYGVVD